MATRLATRTTTGGGIAPLRLPTRRLPRPTPLEVFLTLAVLAGLIAMLSPTAWREGVSDLWNRVAAASSQPDIPAAPDRSAQAPAAVVTIVGPARVIDGDTLDIDGRRIRLFGVDAFERDQTCGSGAAAWACGRAGTDALERRLDGRTVSCEPLDVDRYGRTVARCRTGGEDIGGWMTARGLALAYRRYSLDYVEAEDAARRAGLGVWRDGAATSPEDWRRQAR